MEPDFQSSAPRRVEAYLDQVIAPLTRRLSAFQQQELRRELREHLVARLAAYQELGMTEDDAVTEALRQFGGAGDFLRQWQQEWRKTPPQAILREIGLATRCALLLSFPALLLTCPGSPALAQTLYVNQFNWLPDWLRHTPVASITSGWTSFGLDLIVLPLAVGAAVGRLVPNRAGIGMLAALTLEIILTDWYFLPSVLNLGRFINNLTEQIFFCSIFWLPLACTSAALSGWWTQKHNKRKATA